MEAGSLPNSLSTPASAAALYVSTEARAAGIDSAAIPRYSKSSSKVSAQKKVLESISPPTV